MMYRFGANGNTFWNPNGLRIPSVSLHILKNPLPTTQMMLWFFGWKETSRIGACVVVWFFSVVITLFFSQKK